MIKLIVLSTFVFREMSHMPHIVSSWNKRSFNIFINYFLFCLEQMFDNFFFFFTKVFCCFEQFTPQPRFFDISLNRHD